MISRATRILGKVGLRVDDGDLLDVLWLARRLSSAQTAPLAALCGAETKSSQTQPPVTTDLIDRIHQPTPDALALAPTGREERKGPAGTTTAPGRATAGNGRELPLTAEQPPGPAETANPPMRLPGPRALPDQLRLGRALRPLKRQIPKGRGWELDEVASVEAQSDARALHLVFRPRTRRWLRLVMVIDNELSMLLWERQCAELRDIFQRSGAFWQVEVYQLHYPKARSSIQITRPWSGGSGLLRSPASLRDPSGQTMFVLLTAGATSAWRDGRIRAVLEQWGTCGPTAIIQMLPQRVWAGSGARGSTWHVIGCRPGSPNSAWRVSDPVAPSGTAGFTGLPVPILELSAESLAVWSAAVSARGDAVSVPLWEPPTSATQPQRARSITVEEFCRIASPQAVRLAAYLAAVAPVHIPAMQLVVRELGVGTDPAPLAEVFLGGMLRPKSGNSVPGEQPRARHQVFEFGQDTTDYLLDTVPTGELVACQRRIGAKMAGLIGRSADFPAWLGSHLGVPGGQDHAFALVDSQFLERVGAGDRLQPTVRQHRGVETQRHGDRSRQGPARLNIVITPPSINLLSERAAVNLTEAFLIQDARIVTLTMRARRAVERVLAAYPEHFGGMDATELADRLDGARPELGTEWGGCVRSGNWADLNILDSPELHGLAQAGHALYGALFPRGTRRRGLLDSLDPGSILTVTWHQAGTRPWIADLPWGLMFRASPNPDHPVAVRDFLGLHLRISYHTHGTGVSRSPADRSAIRAHLLYWGRDADDPIGVEARRHAYELSAWEPLALPAGSGQETRRKHEVCRFLNDPHPGPVDLIYFYCRTASTVVGPPGLAFGHSTDPENTVLVSELGSAPLESGPLVFVNASETAVSDQRGSLQDYFFGRGARVFIGTECHPTARLAARFAETFFHFLQANESVPISAGEAFMHARRFLWHEYHDLSGLCYSYFGDYWHFGEYQDMQV